MPPHNPRQTLSYLIYLLLFLLLLLPQASCIQLPKTVEPPDHQAHSKPGPPISTVDWNRDGVVTLTLDATQSHTHYFHHGPPPVTGTITNYQWFSVLTGAELVQTSSPYLIANFSLGVTVLELVVTDSMADKASAYTYVEVREPRPDENQTPFVASVYPNTGATLGGMAVTVRGTAFYNNPKVLFADQIIEPTVVSDTELSFRVPPVKQQKTVPVRIRTEFGTSSQQLHFTYVAAEGNPVKFRRSYVKTEKGDDYNIPQITTMKLGPDARYYAATLNGFIHKLDIDESLTVRSSCISDNAGPSRSILGLAFNPTESDASRIYISTSTLYWRTKKSGADWDNGKVEIWSSDDSDCLAFSRDFITGLPVSARDHSVNGLLFSSDGYLFVSVGGSTNAGVHTHGDKTGGVPESPLSGAILRFDIKSDSFDGEIKYSGGEEPGTARVESGSAEVFAMGVRNVYGLMMHTNGKLYGVDNGPNNGFGLGATGCNTVGRQEEFSDKLLHIVKGAYYGHPNWNRGREDERQCTFVKGDVTEKEGYEAAMAILASSTNGIAEYTANRFNSRLRGQLVLSKLSWSRDGSVKFAELDKEGDKLNGKPYELFKDSGVSVEIGIRGELMMPKLKQSRILVLVPDEPEEGLQVICVTPRRGVRQGGNWVQISGVGFDDDVRIYFGRTECTEYSAVDKDGRSVRCRVPAQTDSTTVSVQAVSGYARSPTSSQGDYEYLSPAST